MGVAKGFLVDLLEGGGYRNRAQEHEYQTGHGRHAECGRSRFEQSRNDRSAPVIKSESQGEVIVDAFAGERTEEDRKRQQREEHASAKQIV